MILQVCDAFVEITYLILQNVEHDIFIYGFAPNQFNGMNFHTWKIRMEMVLFKHAKCDQQRQHIRQINQHGYKI